MQTVTTIGLDIAKSIFQVHGVDTNGNVLIRRKLKRRYVHSQSSGFLVHAVVVGDYSDTLHLPFGVMQ